MFLVPRVLPAALTTVSGCRFQAGSSLAFVDVFDGPHLRLSQVPLSRVLNATQQCLVYFLCVLCAAAIDVMSVLQ